MPRNSTSNGRDLNNATFAQCELDWRNGVIVYQVLLDRFVPSVDLDAKRALYPMRKVLRDWSEVPHPGHYPPDAQLNSQELDFWGGDLASLRARLDYVQLLDVDVWSMHSRS